MVSNIDGLQDSYFIDQTLSDIVPFFYLNCFGVAEQLSLQRNTTEKVKSDRSIATLARLRASTMLRLQRNMKSRARL